MISPGYSADKTPGCWPDQITEVEWNFRPSQLTEVQWLVALLVTKGKSNKEIRVALGKYVQGSPRAKSTIDTHIRTLKQKLEVGSRSEIASWVTAHLIDDAGITETHGPIFELTLTQDIPQAHPKVDEWRITELILKATDAELMWYKNPKASLRADLEQFFLPAELGGERLPRIERTIRRLNEENRRFDDLASKTVLVNTVSLFPDGQTASAITTEQWFQPLRQIIDGEDMLLFPVPEDTYEGIYEIYKRHPLYTYDNQLYTLRRFGGNWYVQSNPVP